MFCFVLFANAFSWCSGYLVNLKANVRYCIHGASIICLVRDSSAVWRQRNLGLSFVMSLSFTEAIVVLIAYGSWILQLPVQSVPTTTKVVSLNPVHGEVYSIKHYVIKFVSDLWQVSGFLWVLQFPPPIKLTTTI